MAKDLAPIPRFPLPDEWEPASTRCVIIRIPDDAQYLAILTGLLDMLKWSDNYARDETKTGAAIVSRMFQTALELQPITWGDCEQMILRQNPDDLCQLEQSQDGGDTWSLAFDYSVCAAIITVPAPYPGSGTGAADAAVAAARNIFHGLLEVSDDICALTRSEYINAATTYMRAFDASYANPVALGQIYDAYCALTEPQQEVYKSDCKYDDQKDDLEGCADSDGLFDWLNCLSAAINDWLNDTSDDLMNALNAAAAALTGNGWQLASQGGAGGGAGWEPTCEWHQIWDFSIDMQGWSAYTGATTYIGGVGWTASGRDLQILIAGPTRTVKRQKIVFGVPSESTTRVVFLNYDTSLGYDQSGVGGVLEWTSGDLGNMFFYGGLFTGGALGVGHSWSGYTVVQVEEWGEGSNPW